MPLAFAQEDFLASEVKFILPTKSSISFLVGLMKTKPGVFDRNLRSFSLNIF